MSVLRIASWTALAGLFCLAGGVLIAFLAQEIYPGYAGPIVLAGILVLGLPLGLVAARVASRGGNEMFVARFHASGRAFYLACLATSVGSLLALSEQRVLGTIGMIVAACGVFAAGLLFVKAVTVNSQGG